MGGSIGHVSVELASQHPNLSFVVQDFARLEPQFDATVPAHLKPRVKFQAHDFFTPQTVKHASVYFLKHILHDWPDHLAASILQNIIPVMHKNSRIVLMEIVLPEGNGASVAGEDPTWLITKVNTALDLQMMAAMNAKERSKTDWVNLVRLADSRLMVKAVVQPLGSAVSLIEVALRDE